MKNQDEGNNCGVINGKALTQLTHSEQDPLKEVSQQTS